MTASSNNEPPEERGLVSRRTMEMVVAAAVAAMAALAIYTNHAIGSGWSDEGPQAGYFPMWIGVIVLVCSLITFIQAWRQGERTSFVTATQLRQVFVVLIPLTIYVALIGTIGIYVASALFLIGFMIFIGKFAWWKSLGFSVAVIALIFWVFEIQFRVPLPKGPLEMALGF